MEEGIKVLIHEDIRWLKCDIKSLNLLGSILVKNKAVELGAKEAVLHRSGFVTEGGSTNVFVVKENVLYTHPANNLILDGITKNVVIEIANKYQIKVVEDAFTLDFFKDADEAFTTSSTAEIMPVISYLEFKNGVCEENTLGKGERGEITKFLQVKFGEEIS
jgi:D-alanine transaminase